MTSKPHKDRGHREKTDRSLNDERGKTDRELIRARESIEASADEAVKKARAEADATLGTAREKADADLAEPKPRASTASKELQEERRVEDGTRAEEREILDRQLAEERGARQRALVELLRTEREATDQNLLSERVSVDDAVHARDEFLAIVSHDLRTLLGGVSLSAAVLHRRGKANDLPDVTREADRLRALVARMNHLIGDLVDVASIEVGKLAVVPRPDDARRLIRETMEAFQAVAAARGTTLEGDVDAQALLATFDHERILQVLPTSSATPSRSRPKEGGSRFRWKRRDLKCAFR